MASLSPMSNMSPATSDFPGPNIFVYSSFEFQQYVAFSASVGPVRMLEDTEQRMERFLM